MTTMNASKQLESTIAQLAHRGKGILAADESTGTIQKRFEKLGVECTEEKRREYRSLLCSTPGLNEFIAGVILYEETLGQNDLKGTPLPLVLKEQGILPGIKVDKGLIPLSSSSEEMMTQGLDGLAERLQKYKEQGAFFAKWREVFTITEHTPSEHAIKKNAEIMADYASICQSQGIVPIVEPEILMNGAHPIERTAEVTEKVLHLFFDELHQRRVVLEHIVLKPNMVIAGEDAPKNSPEEVGEWTVKVLKRTVPAAVPTINFLSGGQSSKQATENLNAINSVSSSCPWQLSYSYGRALQEDCLRIWANNPQNVKEAQDALYLCAKRNSAAVLGQLTLLGV